MSTRTLRRVDALERAFGDPTDVTSPVGHAALLDADERQEMSVAGEALLDRYGLGAEFVPAALGGRFTQVDEFVEVMRAVWRRDPCLGLGYGFASFIAAVNVWASGDPAQQRTVAELLLRNRKVSSAYHELAHGNDFSRAEFAATPEGSGWRLNGRKEVVTNLRRCDAMVVFARTSPAPGSRSHSQFLVVKDQLEPGALRYLPRFTSAGMRGVPLGGAEFVDCAVSGDSILGAAGRGVETALCSFQLTRSTMPAMMVGILDTVLRISIGFAQARRLYGGAVIDLPYVRGVLVDAFTDLLTVDAFSTVVTRALHLLPDETSVLASASKYLNARLLMDATDALATVLGAQSYLREGPYAIAGKLARDLAPAGFGHASRAACQVTILPQLPRLARRAWFNGEPAPPELFRPGAPLPELRFERLLPGLSKGDGITATLVGAADAVGGDGPLPGLIRHFRGALRSVRLDCLALPPRDLTIDASTSAYELAARYTVVLAAACCVGVWWQHRGTGDPFLGDEGWVTAALARLARRLGPRCGPPPDLTPSVAEGVATALLQAAVERHEARRTFDLSDRSVPG
ncbi:MAG: hypothetical protein V7603_3995 [Micromonosporaceae bacterium]